MKTMLAAARTAVLVVWMAVTVVPFALATMLLSLVVRGAPPYWTAIAWARLSNWGLRVFCGVHVRRKGWERIESLHARNQPVILCSKHQSTWETLAYPGLMPRPLAFVFKKELLRIPFFGWALGRLDMIHIDRSKRGEAGEKVARQGRDLMARGLWVIMFPEGTRIARGEQGEYKLGAARLALATHTPIVPLAVASARCWPKKGLIKWPGVVDVSVGEPISPQGHTPESLMRAVESWIESEMRAIDPQAYPEACEALRRHNAAAQGAQGARA